MIYNISMWNSWSFINNGWHFTTLMYKSFPKSLFHVLVDECFITSRAINLDYNNMPILKLLFLKFIKYFISENSYRYKV